MIQLVDKINCTDLRLEHHHTSSSKNILTLQFTECNSILVISNKSKYIMKQFIILSTIKKNWFEQEREYEY